MGLISGPPVTRAGRARDLELRDQPMWGIGSAQDLIPLRTTQMTGPKVTPDVANRHSAVWAAKRLRADLVSTMPFGVWRKVNGIRIAAPTPPVLLNPGGGDTGRGGTGMPEWLYGSQWDLDSVGNAIGIITKRDGNGTIARVELAPAGECSVLTKSGQITGYRIGGVLYKPEQVWHEKAYTPGGLPVGLSPIMYAAWAIGEYLSVQQFALDWFVQGAVPRARLQNTEKKIDPFGATVVKEAWRASIASGEPFVHGTDWQYDMIQAQSASQDWIDAKKYSITDVARFMGVPADLIDSAATGETRGSITYANISQRNLQFLIMQLGPAIYRREAAISNGLLLQPRYFEFETKSLLRMDPATRADMVKTLIDARVLTPDEARAQDDLPPITDDQLLRLYCLFGYPVTGGVPAEAPGQAPAVAVGDSSGGTGQVPVGTEEPPPAVPGPGGGQPAIEPPKGG